MKKVVTINISGHSFYIDEDAFARLDDYLKKLEVWSQYKESGREIYADIEARIRELFEEKINPTTSVITMPMVEEIIAIMGQPEDFSEESSDDQNKEQKSETFHSTPPPRRRLYRDVEDRVIGGVCSGIAAYFNIDRVFVRVLFAVLPFLSFGAIIPIYIILWIAIPPALTAAQRLEMQGHDVNISNIEKNIRDEYYKVKSKFQKSNAYRKGEDYLSRIQKRDRTALIIASAVIGIILVANIINVPFNMGWTPGFHFNFPFALFGFSGIFPLILILLLLGLAFRTAMKGFLILIVIALVAAFMFKIMGLFIWPHWLIPHF
ncbi:PspC domain-containing protein [Thermophagus sp. OGC60D27]|uniref:PspC domain-containing protein n=1 Tax=Thermophagus sp. OGC60D27 TaxID=3458415 RepID=UPI00403833C1